jgi:predicted nucleic acid-binding protein
MIETYWPDAAQVNACIKNEAETADVAVLLAVHQPSPLTTRDVSSGLESVVTEDDLLEAFLTDDVPGGFLLFPVTGASGAGKSHMIRWLDAQLQRSAKRDQLHIIRIPKSASLRTVVERILEPLKDNPAYAKARGELTRAVAAVNLDAAVLTFRAHLEFALKEIGARLEAEYRENPDRTDLRPRIGHARDLPKLFADAALADHFSENVLSRIVRRALTGRAETSTEEDDRKSRFVPEDLELPPQIDLSDAAQAVKSYYQRNLATADATRIRVAIDLLNDAIDPAIGNVFQLQQSTGGMTFQDIILAVRETLLEEGKDLVLLVEDFAALSGIQDALLKVCIQEGVHGGNKIRATMRTAMALTDGVLSFRDTVFTRAQKEWIVGGRDLTDPQIKDAAVDLVGAYLNAARWGESQLQQLFKPTATRQTGDWLPVWRDDTDTDRDQALLDAFGYSPAGAPLFPLNRQAISVLADAHLTKNGVLVFNPRKVINELLRNTLLMRRLYEANSFPSVDQRGFVPNTFLANWIKRTNQSEAVRKRLAAFLAVWGGNPSDEDGLSRLPPGLFDAFGLPDPNKLANIEFVEPAPPPNDEPNGPPRPQPLVPEPSPPPGSDPWTARWLSVLDDWAGGTELGQSDARAIRNALHPLLEKSMEWPRLRIRKRAIAATSISIPNARGNPSPRRALHVCDSFEDEGGAIRAGLLGALRFEQRDCGWTYPEADDDYVAVFALVDRLTAQAEQLAIQDAQLQIRTIAQGLLTQARIGGLAPPLKAGNVPATLTGLFEPLPALVRQEFDPNWDALREAVWAPIGGRPGRETLQSELHGLLSAFQGGGSTSFGIDSVRLLDSLASTDEESSPADGVALELQNYLRPFGDKRVWLQIQPLIAKLRQFRAELSTFVDGEFDKSSFVKDLSSMVALLIETGTWPDRAELNIKEFTRRVEDFRSSPVVELVEKTRIADEATQDQSQKVLNALGSLDLTSLAHTRSFLGAAEQIVDLAQMNVDRAYAARDQADPERIADEIEALLRGLQSLGVAATDGAPA